MNRFPTLLYLGLAVAIMLMGIALRFMPVGLPFGFVKWGGSVLWAAMVYLLFAAVLPERKPLTLFWIAGVSTSLVELFRLYHTPGLDAFRLTLAGALLLGRVYSKRHFVCYLGGAAGAALSDWALIRRRAQ